MSDSETLGEALDRISRQIDEVTGQMWWLPRWFFRRRLNRQYEGLMDKLAFERSRVLSDYFSGVNDPTVESET